MSNSMSSPQQIVNGLKTLSTEAKSSKDPSSQHFGTNIDVVRQSVERIYKTPDGARTPGEKAALKALEIWKDNPDWYAYSATLPGRNGMGELRNNDGKTGNLKCNRFVGEVFRQTGSDYPLAGFINKYPMSAENMYKSDSVAGMTNVSNKEAKIGDVISFPGHVGIYLGNSTYVSAHVSQPYGNQSPDGVEIHRVDWSQEPKFRRMNSRTSSLEAGNSNTVANNETNSNNPKIISQSSSPVTPTGQSSDSDNASDRRTTNETKTPTLTARGGVPLLQARGGEPTPTFIARGGNEPNQQQGITYS